MSLRLIDFGIANKIEQDHTSIERDMRCGTMNYMAPEIIDTHEEHDYYKVGAWLLLRVGSGKWEMGMSMRSKCVHSYTARGAWL